MPGVMSAQIQWGIDYSRVLPEAPSVVVSPPACVSQATVFQYRYDLYQRKPYPTLSASALIQDLETKKSLLASGRVGIYLGVFPTYQNRQWIYPVLDIDGEKKSPKSAISRAQGLYEKFWRDNLARHAKWMLSGTGLRCVFPFLIPIELRGGFIRFLESLEDFGVDVGPYAGVDPPPIRLLCYRGQGKQRRFEDKLLDRHSALIDIETLLSIETEADYDCFTRGRPDADEYLSWIHEILPAAAYTLDEMAAPAEIREFLDHLADLQILHELKGNIFNDFLFCQPTGKRRINAGVLLKHLATIGIDWKEREGYYLLSRCPVCGRKKKAYLLLNGTVRCFSSNCQAFRGGGGLPAPEWAGSEFVEYEEARENVREPNFIDIADAESILYERIRNSAGDTAYAVTPGVGKTHAAVARATKEAKTGITVYALPSHRLIDEWVEKARNWLDDGVPVIHFYGRRNKEPHVTCFNYDKVEAAVKKGFSPAQTVCLCCPDHPLRAKRRSYASDGCPYYHQLDPLKGKHRCGLVFCTTHHLPYLLAENPSIREAYIDEQAVGGMLQPATPIGLDELQTVVPSFPDEAQGVLSQIRKAAERFQKETVQAGKRLGRLYSRQPGGTQWDGKTELWRVAGISKKDARRALAPTLEYLLDSSQADLLENGINLNALNWLADSVGEGYAWIHANVTNSTGHLSFKRILKHRIPERTSLTVLDATTDPKELRSLFEREFEVTKLNVRWEGRRVFLHQSMGKTKTGKMNKGDMEKYLNAMLEHLPQGVSRALLITHMLAEEKAKEILKRLRPGVVWDSTHYFASRGLNAYEPAQAVLCFGVPVTSPEASADISAVLFPGDHEHQARWSKHQNEAELYQCAHRARFVRHPGRTLIVMGHYWPENLLGRPDLVIDRRRNQHSENPKRALERALAAYDALGFFTKEVAAWVGIGMKRDEEKVGRTRKAMKAVSAEILDSQRTGIVESWNESGAPSPIYKFYIKLGAPEWDQLLLSAHKQFWPKLLPEMERQRPGAGRLSVRLPHWGNRNFTRALGTIEAARKWTQAFAEALKPLGYEIPVFNKEAWKEGW